jgi:hypothetical protein
MSRHVKQWGPGYPEADTGPLTDREREILARRMELEPEDAGRRPRPAKRDTEVRRCVGLELTEWE